MFAVTILGNNSALPAFDRHPTAQALTLDDQIFLIDCGEGTQMQLSKYKVRRSKINYIFISHLHGDHYFGLIGLVNSMALLGRETALHIFAPALLQPIIERQLAAAAANIQYPLHFHALEDDANLVDEAKFSVKSFPVQHRIPCWGFQFSEKKPPRKIWKEQAIEKGIPAYFYKRLLWGEDYFSKEGEKVPNESVTYPNSAAKSYVYCADTKYDESLIPIAQGATLLYHETTYLKDLNERAAARFHSTTEQAAMLAEKAKVQRLIIGHFSSKYESLSLFLEEAKAVFANTDLAEEGVTYLI